VVESIRPYVQTTKTTKITPSSKNFAMNEFGRYMGAGKEEFVLSKYFIMQQ
jgi:hypothetical protein